MSPADAALLGITADQILLVYSWGFGVMLMSFLMGYGVSLAIGLIRKV